MEAAHCLGDAWAAHSTALNQALSEAILTPVVRGRGELRILEEEEEEEEEGICRAEIGERLPCIWRCLAVASVGYRH